MQQIERGIYYEDSFLGVTLGGLVFAHGTVMIDAPLRSEEARSWRSILLNQRGGPNRILVILDSHPDRSLGVRNLDTTVVSQQKTAQILRNRPAIFKGQNAESGAVWESYPEAIGMRWASPDITFSEAMSFHWGGPAITAEHHPGPAPGATWVIIPEEQVIFVGDTVVVNQPPFLANANIEEWLESLDLLVQNYRDYFIVSGRGGPAAIEAVRLQSEFLQDVRKRLSELADENEAPEETDALVEPLLKQLSFPPEMEERYSQRLRNGLYQYYTRRYQDAGYSEESESLEEEP